MTKHKRIIINRVNHPIRTKIWDKMKSWQDRIIFGQRPKKQKYKFNPVPTDFNENEVAQEVAIEDIAGFEEWQERKFNQEL